MTLTVSAENEQILDDLVKRGYCQTRDEAFAEALRLLRDSKNGHSENSSPPIDEWLKTFDQWMAAVPRGNPRANFSREAIYDESLDE